MMRWFAYLTLAPLLGVGVLMTACGRTGDDILDTSGGGPSTEPDGSADTSTCTDTTADPHNCGRCGHDCQGGSCQAGVCQPFALATGEEFPEFLRVDEGRVYWMNLGAASNAQAGGAIRSIGKHGEGLRTLHDLPQDALGVAMALDRGNVYWLARSIDWSVTDGMLQRVSKEGADFATLVEHTFPIQTGAALVADGAHVYWLAEAPVEKQRVGMPVGIMRCTPQADDASFWASDGDPLMLCDDADDVYGATVIADHEEISAYDKRTGVRRSIAAASGVTALAINTTDVFYAEESTAPGNEIVRERKRVSKHGGSVASLGTTSRIGSVTGGALAADDERVYVAEQGETSARVVLNEMHTDGTSPITLWGAKGQITAIALDDTSVYWIAAGPGASTRSIMKVAKPPR